MLLLAVAFGDSKHGESQIHVQELSAGLQYKKSPAEHINLRMGAHYRSPCGLHDTPAHRALKRRPWSKCCGVRAAMADMAAAAFGQIDAREQRCREVVSSSRVSIFGMTEVLLFMSS